MIPDRAAELRIDQTRLCEALGLDPTETASITIDVVPGKRAEVRWEGCRCVDLDVVLAAITPESTS